MEQEFKTLPYREDLTPEQRGRELVALLRQVPDVSARDGSEPFQIPGDGAITWNYSEVIQPDDCGSVGCAIGFGILAGLLPDNTDNGRARGWFDFDPAMEALDLDKNEFNSVFIYADEVLEERLREDSDDPEVYVNKSEVTPHQVAMLLEDVLNIKYAR